jgi:nitrile hydratase
MEGPHNLHTWAGSDPIPDKLQPESVVWPEPWEGEMGAIFAMFAAAVFPTKGFNLDVARWLRETVHPRDYLNFPYFDLWLRSVATFLDLSGNATRAELTGGYDIPDWPSPGASTKVRITNDPALDLAAALRNRALTESVPGFGAPRADGSYQPDADHHYVEGQANNQPRYRVGDRVRTVLQTGTGHTREYPLYRGRNGVITASYGIVKAQFTQTKVRVFQPYYQPGYPDIACRDSQRDGVGHRQEFLVPVYNVRFAASDLYGDGYAEEGLYVHVDMFEPYLKFLSAANPGDLNGDGIVDRADYTVFRAALGKSRGQPGYNERADYDRDGRVTNTDYRTWLTYYRR